MKVTVLSLFISFFALTALAQNGGFNNGDSLLNIGVGVNSYYDSGIPLGVSYEKGISDNLSVGGEFSYLSTGYKYYNLDSKFTVMYIGARANYHLNEVFGLTDEKIDVYAGGAAGYRSFSWSNSSYDSLGSSYGSGVYLGGLIGGKYYFTDSVGAFIELGATGSSNARIGVAIKL